MGLIEISGEVQEVIFRNETNGYSVLEVEAEKDTEIFNNKFTAVGCMLDVQKGENVKLKGSWVKHSSYGEQFKVEICERIMPTSESAIAKYLTYMISGIGEKTAGKIVEKFGMETLRIIENEPEKIHEIKGISLEKATKICEEYREKTNPELTSIFVFLQKLELSPAFAIKIYKIIGAGAEEKIKQNPYILADNIRGIGFKTADNIAKNLGISHNSPYRVKCGAKYVMYQALQDGHVFLPHDELIKMAVDVLNVEQGLVEDAIQELLIEKIFIDEYIQKEHEEACKIHAIYLKTYFTYENRIAIKLKNISNYEFKDDINIKQQIENISTEIGMSFAKKQKMAIEEALKNGVVVITGGPGTGKTTTINAIIKAFKNMKKNIELAAPTGRAAKRMTQATGCEAKTIHRLLEMGYSGEGEEFDSAVFGKNDSTPLESEVIIIDEMSMVDIYLMDSLLQAVPLGARLILVGDADQLPSVGPGNVLKDIINSGYVKTVRLDEIFRQAQESLIIMNAHKINIGENPNMANGNDSDFFFIGTNNHEIAIQKVCELCKTRLPDYKNYNSFSDIQVMTPMKKGSVGVANLNIKLQEILNPISNNHSKKEIKYRDTIFREGDKVMQVKNNYDIEWYLKDKPLKRGVGVFNGDIGIVYSVDAKHKIMKILMDEEKIVEYTGNQFEELELAYCVTIHKSQGSEFKAVIIALLGGPPMIMNRNLLYTAVTRAKEMVVIVGNLSTVFSMVKNNYQKTRYSGLDYKIKSVFGGMKNEYNEL